jgi:hypothetical protein
MVDLEKGRPAQPPRLPPENMPRIPASGAISQKPTEMADSIGYDATKKRLVVGTGYVENVKPAIWRYEVSGKQVLLQWFSYRKADRERPIIGTRRPPSPLGDCTCPDSVDTYFTPRVQDLPDLLLQQV